LLSRSHSPITSLYIKNTTSVLR